MDGDAQSLKAQLRGYEAALGHPLIVPKVMADRLRSAGVDGPFIEAGKLPGNDLTSHEKRGGGDVR